MPTFKDKTIFRHKESIYFLIAGNGTRWTFSMRRSNVDGALARPKGITVNWYNPRLVLRDVFCLSSGAIAICQNPELRSMELNYVAPA